MKSMGVETGRGRAPAMSTSANDQHYTYSKLNSGIQASKQNYNTFSSGNSYDTSMSHNNNINNTNDLMSSSSSQSRPALSFLRHDSHSQTRDSSNNWFSRRARNVFDTYQPYFRIDKWSKDDWILLFTAIVLVVATVSERLTFKMAADRMTAYRVMLELFILSISMVVFSLITFLKRGFTDVITEQMREFSHEKLFKMAALDVIQFSGLIVTATGVPPTMTVLLLHASTPCLVYGTRYLFPDRNYSAVQMRGAMYIAISMLVSVSRPVLWMFTKVDYSCAVSSLFYVAAAALQGMANLYKEKCIIEWGKPMDMYFLNSWLFIYQLLIALVVSPLIYMLQIITSETKGKGFPLEAFPRNIIDGYKCVWGTDPYPYISKEHGFFIIGRHGLRTPHYDATYTECDSWNITLIVVHVLSNVVIFECVHRILQRNNKVLGHVMTFALLMSFLALGFYDSEMDFGLGLFGTTIGLADIVSVSVLLFGLEIYSRDPEPDVEIITDYVPNST